MGSARSSRRSTRAGSATRSMAGTGTSPDLAPVPLFDLRIEDADLEAVAAALRSGDLAAGERVAAFETAFAEQLGVRHPIAVASCTGALHLAYRGAGVGPGDEVIVPSYTFAATAAAVLYCGATPVFAEVLGPHDLSVDPEHVASLISPRTKAVAAVHFAGFPAPVDELRELCDEHGLALIEDVAHAPGATLQGRALGSWGLAGAFSFFSNKVLSVGEGGLLATDDEHVAERARALRVPGREQGFPYAMDEPRGALLLSRLSRLHDDIARRREHTRAYRAALATVPGITIPYADDQIDDSSCYIMPVLVDDAGRRDALRIALRTKHRIQTSLLYPSVHRFTAYRERFGELSLPRTEDASAREVTLPLFAHMTPADRDRVVEALRAELTA